MKSHQHFGYNEAYNIPLHDYQKSLQANSGMLRYSSIGVNNGLHDERPRNWVSIFCRGKQVILSSITSILALKLIQPPMQWALQSAFQGKKRPGRETGHSPTSSAEVKNISAIPAFPFKSLWHGVETEHWNTFTILCLYCTYRNASVV
jgi:hypothetical protein